MMERKVSQYDRYFLIVNLNLTLDIDLIFLHRRRYLNIFFVQYYFELYKIYIDVVAKA